MRYARCPEVLWRSTSRGPVLLAPHHDRPELLGGAASIVWEVLDDPLTLDQVEAAARAIVPELDGLDVALAELERLGVVDGRP